MTYDVIVVGGGHAGIEAAYAASRLGAKTLLVTLRLETIGVLSCNPAFGGPAKGGLLREVDALGGYASLGADQAAIQCRILGESKGPAARATRNLVDRGRYSFLAQEFLKRLENLTSVAGEAQEILAFNGRVKGLKLVDGREYLAGAVVLTGGTFWNGRIYHGLESEPGGRVGEGPATYLKESLCALGHKVGRLSTSTAPRLIAQTIDTRSLVEQPGDQNAQPFSVLTGGPKNLVSCYLTWTNPRTHKIVTDNIKTSIIYADNPVSSGPRYCPSLEDKIHNFPQRERHQIFLEPDGPELVYPSGLPTGLAPWVQELVINSIEGLERASIARAGYAIEYDFSDPTYLTPALESRLITGLFFAGQINGTSGYEEAASQGIWAGVSAALRASGGEPFYLGRDESLIGVMLDDLTVQGVSEPYRMLSSRAEWRLRLREDNADLRLSHKAWKLGLLDQKRKELLDAKLAAIEKGKTILKESRVTPKMALTLARDLSLPEKDFQCHGTLSAAEYLKRPQVKLSYLAQLFPELALISPLALSTLETEIKFAGYLSHQEEEILRLKKQESVAIPLDINLEEIPGLTREAIDALKRSKPATLGQAGRLRGITPAALSALAVFIRKFQLRLLS
ncbi:MAG: tRNA uridine-5-carboxymethylaminomethyl(34) synthesis enzyme MnmG [Deltaproteobacteria bacterium]|nr:tRNA uridine-5-carboxymethylaminomethyl(34) synthesis enzyme MnmG [Deltaproteobacteria bacterium]